MNKIKLDFVESELKIILEALIEKENRMSEICTNSDDEDEVADIGNDLIELRLLLNTLRAQAIKQFGENILNFSKDLL